MGRDHAWFTRVYQQFYPRVLGYALHRTPPDHAREIADETFLIAWRRRADIPDAPLPWLLVTARNTISNQLRRKQRQDALSLELARCAEVARQPGADATVLERITVLTALARLTEQDREILMLTVWDGLTTREASAAMDCSTATFAVRLHRARRRLVAALERLDHDGFEATPATPSTVASAPNDHVHLGLGEERG